MQSAPGCYSPRSPRACDTHQRLPPPALLPSKTAAVGPATSFSSKLALTRHTTGRSSSKSVGFRPVFRGSFVDFPWTRQATGPDRSLLGPTASGRARRWTLPRTSRLPPPRSVPSPLRQTTPPQQQQPPPSCYPSTMAPKLRLQKRLAASVLKCGQRRIWLDAAETDTIGQSNSRAQIKKNIKASLIIKKPVNIHSRARVVRRKRGKGQGPPHWHG